MSGIMKAVSPFITLFHNEHDYPSVEYMTRLSTKHILIFIISIGILFIIFPEILLILFNISNQYGATVSLAIRITSLGLVGRCISLTIENYTQSISQSRISARLALLQEFIFPILFAALFVSSFGGVGIWIALASADIMPVFVYLIIAVFKKEKDSQLKNSLLMIPSPDSYHWTSIRGNFEKMDDSMQESNKQIIRNIKKTFGDDYLIITGTLEDIAKNIFITEKTVSEIDISIIFNRGYIVLRFIYDGHSYNPFENEELLNAEHIKDLNKLNHTFDYYEMFDMNFSYLRILQK